MDANPLASWNAIQEPRCDDFGGGIFKAVDVIEQTMIELPQQRLHDGIDLGKVLDEAARVDAAEQHDRDAVIVTVQIPAAMVFRHARKIVSGFEPVPTADSRLLDRFARATAFGRSGGGPIDGCRGNMLVHGIPIRLCAWADSRM